jgi:hypothetical protein
MGYLSTVKPLREFPTMRWPVLLALLLSTSASAAEVSASDARVAFVASTFENCIKTRTADPANAAALYVKTVQYCDCVSTALADRLPPDDLVGLDQLARVEPAVAAGKIQPVLRQVVRHCAAQ